MLFLFVLGPAALVSLSEKRNTKDAACVEKADIYSTQTTKHLEILFFSIKNSFSIIGPPQNI